VTTATYAFESTVLNVTQQNQITVQLNGQNIPFTFNPTTHQVTGNLTLIQGANTLQVSATNADGSDSKQTTLIYRLAPPIQKPVITLKSPTTCPALLARGPQVVTGTITGVSNANQVTIVYNNTPVVFTSTIANNTLTFSCTITVLATTSNFPLVITATNQGGVTLKECLISIKDYAGGGNDQTSPVDGGKPKPTPAKPRTPIVPTDTIRKPTITPPTTPAQP